MNTKPTTDTDKEDAECWRELCKMLQAAYEGDEVHSSNLTVYCEMQSGWRDVRSMKAEILWKDTRDEPIDLKSAVLAYIQRATEVAPVETNTTLPTALKKYLVSLYEEPGDKFILHFDCMAEDEDHAIEQAVNAYPVCEVRGVVLHSLI